MANTFIRSGQGTIGNSTYKTGGLSYGDDSVSADFGPTSATSYYAGIAPPVGGYAIYYNKGTGGPSIHIASNATQAMFFLKSFGATGSTITNMLAWCTAQPNYHYIAG